MDVGRGALEPADGVADHAAQVDDHPQRGDDPPQIGEPRVAKGRKSAVSHQV